MDKIRLLVARDLDMDSARRLVEKFLCCQESRYDLCCLLGPFALKDDGGKGSLNDEEKEEEEVGAVKVEDPIRLARAQGDASAIIAQVENISCRVVYTPSSLDLVLVDCIKARKNRKQAPMLTNISKCVHGQRLRLIRGLVIAGSAAESSEPCKGEGTEFIQSILSMGKEKVLLLTPAPQNDRWVKDIQQAADYQSNVVLHVCAPSSSSFSSSDSNDMEVTSPVVLPLGSLKKEGCHASVVLETDAKGGWRVSSVDVDLSLPSLW